jgi:type I restriction enzyme S subunit
MSWKNVKLGDILTESKEISEFPNPDRRITVRLKVLGVEKRGLENEVEGATKQYIRKAGQFIYGKQNFHKGAFGIVPQELNNFESSSDLPAFDVDKSCLPEFIFYFFKQGNFYLELSKIASGVATQRINTAQLFQLELLLPDIKTQKKLIANIESLETNGGAISTEFKHQLTLVKKLRQQLLQDAVKGKLVEQNKKDEPASELLKKIKAEKEKLIAEKKLKKEKELAPIKAEEIPFEIPVNWVWCRGEIVATYIDPQPSHRTPPESTDGIPYIAMSDIRKDGSLDFNSARKVSNTTLAEHQNRYKLKEGDFIFGKIGTIGKPVKLLAPFNYTLSANVILIQPERRIVNQDYLFYFLSSPAAEKNLIENKSTMSYPVFGMGKARNMPIPLPPLSEQIRIVQKLDELMQYCNSLEASIKQSAAQNERLLQQVLREALRKEPVEV